MSKELVEQILREHGARLRPKADSRMMKILGGFFRVFGNKRFVESYWTTIRDTIYYPTTVNDPYRYVMIIAHECVHVSQWRKWRALFLLSYLFFPVPVFFAWFRWRWEREAYLVNLRPAVDKEKAIERVVNDLWHDYLWPWPKKRMRKWFRAHV